MSKLVVQGLSVAFDRDIVEKFGVSGARIVNTPMLRELQLRRGDDAGETTDKPYAEVVGSLMYLTTCTQPDLAQSVGAQSLSRYVSDPRKQHWLAAEKVLRYVVGTLDLVSSMGARGGRS
jgi:hypothetical protein